MFPIIRQLKRLWMRPSRKDRRGLRTAAGRKSKPQLEVLEDRIQPATVVWSGSSGLGANRQRIVQSGRCFFRHSISMVKVCGSRQQPRG